MAGADGHETVLLDDAENAQRLGAAAHALHDLVVRLTAEQARVNPPPPPPARAPPPRSAFACDPAPPIALRDYAVRLSTFLYCSSSALVVAHAVLRRLFRDWGVLFEPSSHHKLLVTACVLGAKWADDRFYSNRYYAEVGGISGRSLGMLEREMLRLLGFRLFVSVADFTDSLEVVVGRRPLVVGQFRHSHAHSHAHADTAPSVSRPPGGPASPPAARAPKRSLEDDAHAAVKRARAFAHDLGDEEGAGATQGDLGVLSPVSGLLNTDLVEADRAAIVGADAPVYRSLSLARAEGLLGRVAAPPSGKRPTLCEAEGGQWDDPLAPITDIEACLPVEFAPVLCCVQGAPKDVPVPALLALES